MLSYSWKSYLYILLNKKTHFPNCYENYKQIKFHINISKVFLNSWIYSLSSKFFNVHHEFNEKKVYKLVYSKNVMVDIESIDFAT